MKPTRRIESGVLDRYVSEYLPSQVEGHKSIDTTQLYAQIRPAALKHAVDFYEAKALDVLSS